MTVFPDCPDPQNHNGVNFEEAMTISGFGKFNILSTFFCGFMLLGMILETLGFSYVIPACQCDLELTLTLKGWIAAIPFMGIILTSHLWGYLADTKGRKKILIFCMSVGSTFSILSSLSPNLIVFIIMRFIASIFIAGPSALGYAYLGELNPLKHRDKMLTLGNAAVAIGTAVVPLVAWAVLPTDFHISLPFLIHGYRPWRLLVALFATPYLICAVLINFFPESPKFLLSNGKTEETLKVLQKIYSVNTGNSALDYPVKFLTSETGNEDKRNVGIFSKVWEQTAPLFRQEYLKYSLIICFLQFGCFATTNGFYLWFPEILNKIIERGNTGQNICDTLSSQRHTVIFKNESEVSFVECKDTLDTNTFTVSIILGSIVGAITIGAAFLIQKLGKRNILIGIFLLVSISSFILHWITNPTASIVVFSIIQLCGTNIGLVNAYAVEIFPTNVRAMAVCLSMMIGRIGSVFGTNIIGQLIENVCPVSFFLFSILLLGNALTCLLLSQKKKSKPDEEITKTSL